MIHSRNTSQSFFSQSHKLNQVLSIIVNFVNIIFLYFNISKSYFVYPSKSTTQYWRFQFTNIFQDSVTWVYQRSLFTAQLCVASRIVRPTFVMGMVLDSCCWNLKIHWNKLEINLLIGAHSSKHVCLYIFCKHKAVSFLNDFSWTPFQKQLQVMFSCQIFKLILFK